MEEFFMLGFCEGRTENGGFLRGNLSFRGKKGSPAPLPKKAAFTRSAPRRAGQAAYGTMRQGTRDGERGVWRGNLSFWRKKGSPAPLPKKAAFTRSAPRRAGQAAYGRMRREMRNGERGFFAGEPFFLEKERFPRAPSKESRFYAVCPAESGSGRGVRAPAPPSVGRTRVPAFLGRAREGPSFS